MLQARIESAASAFTALSPLVRNLPPPDMRLIVPKGCSTVIVGSSSSWGRRKLSPPFGPERPARPIYGWSAGHRAYIAASTCNSCRPKCDIGSPGSGCVDQTDEGILRPDSGWCRWRRLKSLPEIFPCHINELPRWSMAISGYKTNKAQQFQWGHQSDLSVSDSNDFRKIAVRHLESVRRLHEGLQSFLSMRQMEARRRKASALRLRFSQSLASRR